MDLQKVSDLAGGAGWLGFLALLIQRWWQSRDTTLQVTAEAERILRADLMRLLAERDTRIDQLQREVERLGIAYSHVLGQYARVHALCLRAGLEDNEGEDVAPG